MRYILARSRRQNSYCCMSLKNGTAGWTWSESQMSGKSCKEKKKGGQKKPPPFYSIQAFLWYIEMMEIKRRKTRPLKIGHVTVGGDSPVSVQSMANTHTADVSATVSQIKRLEEAGCEIIRVAVPDESSAAAISQIKKAIKIPLIADIHFDWKLALKSLDSGADALRLNPGNIGSAV